MDSAPLKGVAAGTPDTSIQVPSCLQLTWARLARARVKDDRGVRDRTRFPLAIARPADLDSVLVVVENDGEMILQYFPFFRGEFFSTPGSARCL